MSQWLEHKKIVIIGGTTGLGLSAAQAFVREGSSSSVGIRKAVRLPKTSLRRLAVASLANLISPEAVVIGGGITQAGDALFGPPETLLDLFEWRPSGKKTALCKAHFDDWAGAIGAAASLI